MNWGHLVRNAVIAIGTLFLVAAALVLVTHVLLSDL